MRDLRVAWAADLGAVPWRPLWRSHGLLAYCSNGARKRDSSLRYALKYDKICLQSFHVNNAAYRDCNKIALRWVSRSATAVTLSITPRSHPD